MKIEIAPGIHIEEDELRFHFVRSSGPGGQNVNKVATAVQLRFDVKNTTALSEEVIQRLTKISGKRMTGEGILIIEARRFRTQERNRADALERLTVLVLKALEKPAVRIETKPSRAYQRKRLEIKKKRGEIKKGRRKVRRPDLD